MVEIDVGFSIFDSLMLVTLLMEPKKVDVLRLEFSCGDSGLWFGLAEIKILLNYKKVFVNQYMCLSKPFNFMSELGKYAH